jgi:hypothetical protein
MIKNAYICYLDLTSVWQRWRRRRPACAVERRRWRRKRPACAVELRWWWRRRRPACAHGRVAVAEEETDSSGVDDTRWRRPAE